MNTTINTSTTRRLNLVEESVAATTSDQFCVPHFDSTSQPHALKLEVFLPEVDSHGLDITIRDTDLFITAKRRHIVRQNWAALHLESVQRDYALRLRLGPSLDLFALEAELTDGILTLLIPAAFSSDRSDRPPTGVAA